MYGAFVWVYFNYYNELTARTLRYGKRKAVIKKKSKAENVRQAKRITQSGGCLPLPKFPTLSDLPFGTLWRSVV